MSVSLVSGNIFNSSCSVLVNPTNCIGPMGKGLALQFKNKYPYLENKYKHFCSIGLIKPGILYLYKINENLSILNFPTKNHWKDPSSFEYIKLGLNKFIDTYNEKNIRSIAWPLLGTGLGGLDKDLVKVYMFNILSPLPDIKNEIYID